MNDCLGIITSPAGIAEQLSPETRFLRGRLVIARRGLDVRDSSIRWLLQELGVGRSSEQRSRRYYPEQ